MRSIFLFWLAAALFMSGCASGPMLARVQLARKQPGDYFQNPSEIALLKGAARGDAAQMDAALKQGADVNAVGDQGMTPLAWAIAKQNKAGFLYLLQHGANPNYRTKPVDRYNQGTSIIELTAMLEDPDYLKFALNHGGNANGTTDFPSQTLVFTAVKNHRKENVKTLFQHGAELNHRDAAGFTALLHARDTAQYDIVLLLLDLGADPKIEDNFGWDLRRSLKTFGHNSAHPEQDKYYHEVMKRFDLE
jgi:ankyrin repeat protein